MGAISSAVFCGPITAGLCRTRKCFWRKELIEEAERWDLETKPASLSWSGTCAEEGKEDMMINTRGAEQVFPFEKSFKILGYIGNPAGKSQEGLEKRKHGGGMHRSPRAKTCRGG